MPSTEKIWADTIRETGIWLAPYAAQVADFGRSVLPKLRERDERIAELEGLIRELLDVLRRPGGYVWDDPEGESGKSLHQRATAMLAETFSKD